MENQWNSAWTSKELLEKYITYDIRAWLDHGLFEWNWWILVAFLIVPWIVWIRVFDRKRVMEISLFGCLVVIITTLLDAIGTDLSFWIYPVELFPITPRAIAFDMSLIAIAFMLLYQYFDRWKTYSMALISMALIFAFIAEPICHYLNLVFYVKWEYYYSFFYYTALGIFCKFIIERLKKISVMTT